MNNGNYATIISSRVKRAQVFEYGKPRNLPPRHKHTTLKTVPWVSGEVGFQSFPVEELST